MQHFLSVMQLVLVAIFATPVRSCPCDSKPTVGSSLYNDLNTGAFLAKVWGVGQVKGGFMYYRARIPKVYKGTPPESYRSVYLKTTTDSCGFELDQKKWLHYLLFVSREGNYGRLPLFIINPCNENKEWSQVTEAEKQLLSNYPEKEITLVIRSLQDSRDFDGRHLDKEAPLREIIAPVEVSFQPPQSLTKSMLNISKVEFYPPPALDDPTCLFSKIIAADDYWEGEENLGAATLLLLDSNMIGSIKTEDCMYQLSLHCDEELSIIGRALNGGFLNTEFEPNGPRERGEY